MLIQPASPAPLTVPSPTQTATPPHPVQAAPAPSFSPARFVPAIRPAAVVDPTQQAADTAATEQTAPMPIAPDADAEATLSAEIAELWGNQKAGKATVRRTRAELKSLRQQLGAKLFCMKSVLVGTGREGGWAPYLRGHKLPLATANRYVAEHQAKIAEPVDKLLSEQLPDLTADEVRQAGEKLLPRLSQMLKTQQSVVWFVQDVIMQLPAADGRRTKAGYEVLMPTPQDDVANQQQCSTQLTPTTTVPQRSSLTLLYSQSPR
jgi:hypothetical protein